MRRRWSRTWSRRSNKPTAFDSLFSTPDDARAAPRRLRRAIAARIARWGALRSTLLLTLVSAIGSVGLTCLYLWAKGAHEVGDALYITLFVAVPMTAIGGGICIMLVESLEDMRRRLHEPALTDPLTGLRNRRHFMQWAQRELDLAHRHDLPLAMLPLDIDHFKVINDAHGHAAGTRCWSRSASVARPRCVAPTCWRAGVARNSSSCCPTPRNRWRNRSPSAGARPLMTLDALTRAADRALYDAKRQGRDRVRVSA